MNYQILVLDLLSTPLYHILTTDGKLDSNVIKSSMSEKQFQTYSMEELRKLSCGDFIPSVIAGTYSAKYLSSKERKSEIN